MAKFLPDPPLLHFSPITAFARCLFQGAKWLSVMWWLKFINPIFRPRSELTPEEVAPTEFGRDFTRRRAFAIEMYLIGWLVVELGLVVLSLFGPWKGWVQSLVAAIVGCRIVEIVQVTVNATLFDALSGRPDDRVASRVRMIVLAGINFLELCLCFGVIYANAFTYLRGAGQAVTGYYLSIITQLTIGYGDVFPTCWLRVVAAVHGLASILFVILVFGRFIAALPQVRGIFGDSNRDRKNAAHNRGWAHFQPGRHNGTIPLKRPPPHRLRHDSET